MLKYIGHEQTLTLGFSGGYVWTSSMQDCSVLRVNSAGTSVTRFDYGPYANGNACYTSGLAVDSNNHLWITSRTDPGFVIRVDAALDNAPVLAVVRVTGTERLARG